MELIFVCPRHNRVFESGAFSIRENRGVATDAAGNRFLDAQVVLDAPCPYCGEAHIFQASELSCPFAGKENPEKGK